MDYRELLITLIDRIDDDQIIESLFYIVQKIIGRGL